MEHVGVLIVGAGLSGIGAAHHLQAECPWADYAIVEARGALGGTWDLFRYPGIRSDSEMHTLGYSFRPWTGETSIGDGASIRRYLADTAAAEGIDAKIRFHHRVLRADWSTADARWTVTLERSTAAVADAAAAVETVQLTCGFLFSCSGYYRYDHGYQPDFAGMDRFGGTIVHPQQWPEDLVHAGKRVVVIGSGATAITLIPALAETAAHVTMLQRSPSYVVSLPMRSPVAGFLRRVLPRRWAAPVTRWAHALLAQGMYTMSKRRPDRVRRVLRKGVAQQLPPGYDVDTHFNPRYDPWDQRLCIVPDGDLFTVISEGRASVVTDHVDTFTEAGVRLASGDELEADIIVTATGLELLFIGGIDLTVDGAAVRPSDKVTYKGMMLDGVPNFALAFGYTNASWTLKAELTCNYVCRLLNHLHDRGLRQCMPVNREPAGDSQAFLSLSSGYIARRAGDFPRQGRRFPWQVHESYLRDYRAMKLRGIEDHAMEFSNPAAAASSTQG